MDNAFHSFRSTTGPVERCGHVDEDVIGHGTRHRLPGQEGRGFGGALIGDLGLRRRCGEGRAPRAASPSAPPGPGHRPSSPRSRRGPAGRPPLVWPSMLPRKTRRVLAPPLATFTLPSASSAAVVFTVGVEIVVALPRTSRCGTWKLTSPDWIFTAARRCLEAGSSDVSSMMNTLSGRTRKTASLKKRISALEPGAGAHEVGLVEHHRLVGRLPAQCARGLHLHAALDGTKRAEVAVLGTSPVTVGRRSRAAGSTSSRPRRRAGAPPPPRCRGYGRRR